MRILLVDDNQPLVALLRQYLVRNGHEVVEAFNFAEGLAEASRNGQEKPLLDVAVVDLILPDGSGEDLARRILELHPNGIKLIISTGMPFDPPADLLGKVVVFQKPFLPRELLHFLAR